ncbi:unnamed protein product [Heterobilharzia americana]|nr:unnamed protein product [Heterobilharzia americana]
MLKEKTYFLFRWISLKVFGQSFSPEFAYPIVESDEGSWELNHSFIAGLSSFELYSGVNQIIEFKTSPRDFTSLLEELKHLCGGRQLMLDPAVLEAYSHELLESTKDQIQTCHRSEFQTVYVVQPADLIYPHLEIQQGDNSQTVDQLNLIWLASHIALVEMILRIYLLNLVTPTKLVNALSTLTGCQVSGESIKGLQGADGALFWLVTVAARTVTVLGIHDCTEWLVDHLIGEEKSNNTQSPASSCDSANTINTDSLKSSADIFLRGLAMANLVALTFHFYCPQLAPAEDFLFNFPSTGEMEPAASHHNARTIASICRENSHLHNVLFLMPDSCNGNIMHFNPSGSTTLSTLNLLGFCSQGLARSPTHRRLQHAAMAGELFVWFTSRPSNRETNPLRLSEINYKKNQYEMVTQNLKDINKKKFNESMPITSDTDDNQINIIPLDRVNTPTNSDCASGSGKATYRLDRNVLDFQKEQQQSHFNRSKTIRLNRNQSDVDKLNLRLNELSTKQLINSETGGIFLPEGRRNILRTDENPIDQTEDQLQLLTKWNPLEALFRPSGKKEPVEVFNDIPSTENHVAETECTEHHTSEVMPHYSVPDYWPRNVTQSTTNNSKVTNIENPHTTATTKIQYSNQNPITKDFKWPEGYEIINDESSKHRRSLSHSTMTPVGSFQDKLQPNSKELNYATLNQSDKMNCQLKPPSTGHRSHTTNIPRSCQSVSRKKRNFRHYDVNCVDGYSDSDINSAYNRIHNVKHAPSDFSSSSEGSENDDSSNPYEVIYQNYPDHRRYHCHPILLASTEPKRKSVRSKTRESFRPGRSTRRHQNISENINPSYFYAPPSFQHQIQCMYAYEPSNHNTQEQIYSDIHRFPYTPVQPTWIRPPFVANTINPGSLYMSSHPTHVGSPQIPIRSPLHSTSPPAFLQSNNPYTFLEYNSKEQNISIPEMHITNVHTTKEPTSNELIGLQTEKCGDMLRSKIPSQTECNSFPVEQQESKLNLNQEVNSSLINIPLEIKVPVSYSQAESFFIPFESNSSNVSTTFHPTHNFKSRYSANKSRSHSVTSQRPKQSITEQKHTGTLDNEIDDSSDVNLEPVNFRPSTAQRENHISSSPNNYLEKRSLKASEKETRGSHSSRPSSGKSQNVLDIKEGLLQTNENLVNTPKALPIHQRRTASVSRTIGVVKPNLNAGRRRHTQDELSLLDVKSHVNNTEDGLSNDTKLFVQLQTKSNRRAIANALNYCCLAGPVNENTKRTALEALGCSDGKHFMILLKSHCQYSGLYNYSPIIEKAIRISGTGPSKIENNMVDKYYKYDSGLKRFVEINSTSHLSTVVDAVLLHGRTRNCTKSYAAHTASSSKCPLHGK